MSELSVGAVAVGAGVLLLPLLIVAGVGVGAALLASQAAKASPLVNAASMGRELDRRRRRSRGVLSASLAQRLPASLAAPAGDLSRSLDGVAEAMSLRKAMAEIPALETMVATNHGGDLKRAEMDIAAAARALDGGRRGDARKLAEKATAGLERIARNGVGALREAQQELVSQNVREALDGLGYSLEQASEGDATAYRAVRGAEVLGVVVGPSGKLVVDAAGFAGQSCRLAREALYSALRRQGVFVELEAASDHDPRVGSVLLGESNAANGAGAVLAAYRALEQARASVESARKERHPVAGRVKPRERDRLRRAIAGQILQARRLQR